MPHTEGIEQLCRLNQNFLAIKKYLACIFLLSPFFCFCAAAAAQDKTAIAPADTNSIKIVKWWQILKKPPEAPRQRAIYFFPLPMLSFNPTNNFLIGVGVGVNWFSGKPADTRISTTHLGIAYTLKNQILSALRSSIYTNHDNWILLGDWRYQISSQPGFGIGTGPQTDKLTNTGVTFNDNPYGTEPANVKLIYFDFLRLHETVLRRVIDKFYLGLGYHLDYYYHMNDALLNLTAPVPVITNYYSYTAANGFNQNSSWLSGISVNAIYDTRDNQNTPHSGRYAFVSYKYNPVFLGSNKNSGTIWLIPRLCKFYTRLPQPAGFLGLRQFCNQWRGAVYEFARHRVGPIRQIGRGVYTGAL